MATAEIYDVSGLQRTARRLWGLLGVNVSDDRAVEEVRRAFEENEFTALQGMWLFYDKFQPLEPRPPSAVLKSIKAEKDINKLEEKLILVLDVLGAYCYELNIIVSRVEYNSQAKQVLADTAMIMHSLAKLISVIQH